MRIRPPSRAEVAWVIVVTVVYGIATLLVLRVAGHGVGKWMTLAAHLFEGRLDLGTALGTNDTVTIAGRTYWVAGPLTIIPFVPFVPFHALWWPSRFIVSALLGIGAASLMLPLARAYGPRQFLVLNTRADIQLGMGDKDAAAKTLNDGLAKAQAMPDGQRSDATIKSFQRRIDKLTAGTN